MTDSSPLVCWLVGCPVATMLHLCASRSGRVNANIHQVIQLQTAGPQCSGLQQEVCP
jgi:hypothetical protein